MTKTNIISIEGVTKEFGPIRALDCVNLKIEPGILGLIGPNGAGKTTLLRVLLGLIRPSSGSAEIFGLDVQKDSLKIRKRVGVLHEKTSLPSFMSARNYLSEVIGIYESNKDPDDLLSTVGLHQAGRRQIGHFSAGMKQRMGIAIAFAADAELVFLDEPTANLDVPGREEVLNLIVDLHQNSGISFVISSHILSELEKACTHIAFLNKGKIVEQGKTLDVIQRHTGTRYRILCSDSNQLIVKVKQIEGIHSAKLQGTNAISLIVNGDPEKVNKEISVIADSLNIKYYSMDQSTTLEDAFWDVIA
ncbi:MAG: ABC transporter ATP-binding protein [Candidatus Thorarchaeota archaeon]|nr:ABC transporter ATP-binding protein [Candidatus Thorarchaeota archaeon]